MKYIFYIKRHPGGRRFLAINLFGFIFTRTELTPRQLRHELIHSRQQREMLYLPFFLWYLVEWLCLWVRLGDRMQAYRQISFEREAYSHEADVNYLKNRRLFATFRTNRHNT